MRTRFLSPDRWHYDLTSTCLAGMPTTFLVQNVRRALVGKMVVKFAGIILQDTVGYDIFIIFEDARAA